ncbi:MAG: ligand-binding protein SH3 [Planctomycetia bacterium]|nr:ligand-binding protein SH3 [Planctomycetia bacterium]
MGAPRVVAAAILGWSAVLLLPSAVPAQLQPIAGQQELQTVVSARQALDEFCGMAIESIPPTMLDAAEGIAIFPGMMKGGFILGVNYGKGVLVVRRPDRTWSPPVMVTMGGGSIGFQAGVQSADIVLVFATPRSLEGILKGQKVTLGADASIALGPVGRQANAGTDARLGAEIYSYARSRGLFAGVSLGGADLSVDHNADAVLYGRAGVTPADVFQARGLAFHQEVQQLIDDLNVRAKPAVVPVPNFPPQQPSAQNGAATAETRVGQVPPATPAAPPPATYAPVPQAAPPLVPIRQ